ncbi:MAG: Eco57I restriction-modification methylase domain-containing protein [Gammaproteobacteria bacterium]
MIGKHKEYGVVYTPEWIVDLILDKTMRNYAAARRVCDPACGDGAFLVRLVERVCDMLPARDCRMALENITGFDIDAGALDACRRRLDRALLAKGKKIKVHWDLHCMDSAERESLARYAGRFDYVVGNPPYVRIQHLGKTRRARLQRDWELARRGSTDLYIAFFEIGMFLLRSGGALGYITPNTYTKTEAGRELRHFILQHHAICCLIDFGAQQVFKNATTYSLISILRKYGITKKFALHRHDGKRLEHKGMVPVSRLSENAIWTLQAEETLKRIEKIRNRGARLKEIADIHVGIQTLADDVFILEKCARAKSAGMVTALDARGREVQLEAAITRPILKASVMKNGRDVKTRIIIFPYIDGRLIAEKILRAQFPLAHHYLAARKEILLNRDKGEFDAARWYAFGREFGLVTTFGDKLLTSGMNKQPNFQKCLAPEYTFYAGYCVKPKSNVDIDKLLAVLNSADMEFFIRHTSRDYRHGWKSYAKGFIQDYGIPLSVAGGCARGQESLWG